MLEKETELLCIALIFFLSLQFLFNFAIDLLQYLTLRSHWYFKKNFNLKMCKNSEMSVTQFYFFNLSDSLSLIELYMISNYLKFGIFIFFQLLFLNVTLYQVQV